MNDLLILGIAWLFYVYAGYPVVMLIISLFRRTEPLLSNKFEPSVSVLISAFNEEKDIGWKISETLAWDYPFEKLEVLVASDASDDSTDDIVKSIGDRRVTFVRMKRRGGKVRALNSLVELARGEILFFTDANAHIGPNALRLMVRHMADARVGCVTGDSRPIVRIENSGGARGASVYWSYESVVKRLENRIGSVLVCDGAIFCMRASLFHRLDPNLANDLESPMRVASAGYWVTHEPAALVYEHETSSVFEELKRRRRMCAQGMLAMLKLRDTRQGLRGWQFISHKFLRWLSLIPLLIVFLASTALAPGSVLFTVLTIIQIAFYLLAAGGLVLTLFALGSPNWLSLPLYIVLGLLGALAGVTEALLGRRFDIWDIPTLSRGGAETATLSVQRTK
jgi:cellulose synthase/poly-beta-1,6-N-acetylglucosamine synthase-like glycosyltransferase